MAFSARLNMANRLTGLGGSKLASFSSALSALNSAQSARRSAPLARPSAELARISAFLARSCHAVAVLSARLISAFMSSISTCARANSNSRVVLDSCPEEILNFFSLGLCLQTLKSYQTANFQAVFKTASASLVVSKGRTCAAQFPASRSLWKWATIFFVKMAAMRGSVFLSANKCSIRDPCVASGIRGATFNFS